MFAGDARFNVSKDEVLNALGQGGKSSDEKKKDEKKKEAAPAASYAVNFPLGAFGREAEPPQPVFVVIREATVWTCGKRGVLEKADVLFGDGKILAGFAGATADAFTLFERLEGKLEQYPGQLTRACVELAKDWRTDRYLRRLEAMMAVSDSQTSLMLSGNGDVLEPEDGIIGLGSGGAYALAAARALIELEDLDAETVARKAMSIAATICIYTNENVIVETINTAVGQS